MYYNNDKSIGIAYLYDIRSLKNTRAYFLFNKFKANKSRQYLVDLFPV